MSLAELLGIPKNDNRLNLPIITDEEDENNERFITIEELRDMITRDNDRRFIYFWALGERGEWCWRVPKSSI